MNGEAGKGDTYRKVDQKKFGDNYDRIFEKKKEIENIIAQYEIPKLEKVDIVFTSAQTIDDINENNSSIMLNVGTNE